MASSRADVFPFEKLPAEIRVKIYEYALISPTGWSITWNSVVRFRISITQDMSLAQILSGMSISTIYLNKSIHGEACKILYGNNLFHFDILVDNEFIYDGPVTVKMLLYSWLLLVQHLGVSFEACAFMPPSDASKKDTGQKQQMNGHSCVDI